MMDVMKGLFASDRPTGATVRRRTPAVRQSSPIGAISGMIEEARGDLSSSIRGLFGQQTPEEAQAQQSTLLVALAATSTTGSFDMW